MSKSNFYNNQNKDPVYLSAIVISRDEEEYIKGCLGSLDFAGEVIVVDTGSRDQTIKTAKDLGAKVIKADPQASFADWRNLGLSHAQGEWVFYLDVDERVGRKLRDEIVETITKAKVNGYFVPRRNIFLGQEMRVDKVERLFKRQALKKWRGELSEHPVYLGKTGELNNSLIHLSHRDLSSMLKKTISWSQIEAKLLDQAGHPRMTWWRFPRLILGEGWRRLIKEGYWRFGIAGLIEAVFQTLSVFITYLRLWEIQSGQLAREGRGEVL